MGATRSFSRFPLCQACLFIDFKNPAGITNKLLRKEARVGDLAQGTSFCHCAWFIAALSPPPSHAWCSHSADFVTSLCITQLYGSRNLFYQSLKALWQRRQRNNPGHCHFLLPLACYIAFVRQHWILDPHWHNWLLQKTSLGPDGMTQLDLFPQRCQCFISSGLL